MGNFSQRDHYFMAKALRLAEKGRYTARPNPMVGCVLVKEGHIVGEGWHRSPGEPHAEIHALNNAAERAKGATAYVTLEPCCHHGRTGPCTEALIKAGIVRVICATQDPFSAVSGRGISQLKEAGLAVSTGLLATQAEALNRGFIARCLTARPYVRCKMAMSLDGRTAAADGSSQWITSVQARQDVQRLRAQSDAIMTGIGTVLHDDPALTVRAEEAELRELIDQPYFRPPTRVVVDSQFRLPVKAKMLSLPGKTWVFTLNHEAGHCAANLHILHAPELDARVDLHYVMNYLGCHEINTLLVEAGPTLSGALLSAGLVDELIVYIAPKLLGDAGKGLFHLPEMLNISQHIALDISDTRVVGRDFRITARPKMRD